MNLLALGVAAIGALIVIVGFLIARKVSNRVGAGAIQLAALAVGFFSMVAFPIDTEAAAQAGAYWFFLLIACAVIGKLFGGKKEGAGEKA